MKGFHERVFVGEEDAAQSQMEMEERDLGDHFHWCEGAGGEKLRLLDSFSLYFEDGQAAPPSALDAVKKSGGVLVMFGTVVEPIPDVAKLKLNLLDNTLKGNIPPCLPKHPGRDSAKTLLRMSAAAPTPAAAKGVAGPNRGKGSRVAGKKMKHFPKSTDGSPRKRSAEESASSDIFDSGDGSLPSGGAKSGQDIDDGASALRKTKRSRKSKTSDRRTDNGGMSRDRKKRKANAMEENGNAPLRKRRTISPIFSMAAISMRLDGTESRGIPSADYVGNCFRDGRKDGLLLYYADKAPSDYPLECEPKITGASAMDWSNMRKDLKVDALCLETSKWHGAKVAQVSLERRQVKVHFNGWKSSFDEWMDWKSFRLAPYGSRSMNTSGSGKKASTTRCITVPARRTERVRISRVDDWCIDFSDPQSPILWIMSPNAWYKVAGSGWWDFVQPDPLYAPFFEPFQTAFVVTSLVARCLIASPWSGFVAISRQVFHVSSGLFEARDIVENHKVVVEVVEEMCTPKKSKKTGKADGSDEEAEEDDSSSRSVEGKYTPFLKELRVKAEEWKANGLASPLVHTLPGRGTTKALTDGRLFADNSSGGSGSGGCSKPNDASRSSGDPRSGGGMDVTPNGPLESPRPMGGDPKIGGGGPRAGGKGRKSIGGGSKAGPKAPKGGDGGNTDGKVPKPGGGTPNAISRLAKRYPLPDEELWQEEQQLGIQPRPWPAPETFTIPPGFPARAFEDAVSAWSCLQLFGTLMHLRRFSLNELMVALVEGTDISTNNGASSPSWGHQVQAPPSQLPQGPDPPLADTASLLDIIPAPSTFDAAVAGVSAAPPGGASSPTPKPGTSLLANIHMRLLEFLAWDRTRTLTCDREGKQDAYWKSLLPSLGGGGGGSSNGDAGAGQGASGDDDEFGGAPETTFAGLRGSRELIQASPHGFPELLRLVVIHREGVFRRVEPRRTAVARGFAGLATGRDGNEDERGSIPMQVVGLDPLGEVIRILRFVMQSEESKPFLGTPTDADVNPEGVVTGHQRRRPLDLGTILKRAENGWYDMDPGSQPPETSDRLGAGHAGVAQDVELVQESWLEARGRDSVIYEQARALVDDFMALYEAHVLKPLAHIDRSDREGRCPATEDGKDGDGNRGGLACSLSPPGLDSKLDSMELLTTMGSEEYARWSPAAKTRALSMLCDEAMSSETLSDVARKVFEAREEVQNKDRETKAAVGDIIRGQHEQEPQRLQAPTSTSRRETKAEMVAARVAAEEPELKALRQLGHLRLRLKPLGTDRYRRRYWLLPQGEDHRVFTQLDGEWGCYERVSQLKALHTWLDMRGTRERVLKVALREHLTDNLGVSPDDLHPPSRPSGLAGQDRQKYIGEPAEVAREKERERAAGKEALESCGFFAEEQRGILQEHCRNSLRAGGLAFEHETSAVVMRDLVIHMGSDGLCLRLKPQHGGVVVSKHAPLQPGVVNPGQAAGVLVGDLVISVDSIVAEKPKPFAQDLDKEHLAKSGKNCLMKVLTRVPLTDGRGEPLASAMKYSAVDMVKGALLEGEIMLHHSFVIGVGWEGQACREWRLGVSFAGQGVARDLEHGTLTAATDTWTNFLGRTGRPDGSEAVTFPTGRHPPLQGVGAIELGPMTEEAVRETVEQLGRRMLQLEALVFIQDTVVDARWGEEYRRRKWRTFVQNAHTAPQLLAAWGTLKEMIDWEAARRCFSELDRQTFLALLPGNARKQIPDKGNSVIYFGDGHALSVEAEAKAGHRAPWGVDAPKPGAVEEFTVKSIGYHHGESNRRAKGAQPFVTMELEPLATPNTFPELGLLPPSEPFKTLNRLLKRSIKAMKGTPDVMHFFEPVSSTIYPDYDYVLSEPMDLSKLWERCSACHYKTVEQFKHDLSLVAFNCRLYYQGKFPNLPHAADAAVKVGMATLDEPTFAAALEASREAGSRVEDVWTAAMLAAIRESPESIAMPGMEELSRQFRFSTPEDDGEGHEDDDVGQGDPARVAREVFYDSLLGITYGTSEAGKPSRATPEARAGGTLRVAMRLSNEMPEFLISTSRYEDAVRSSWRSEMGLRMSSSEETVCEGVLVGVKPKNKDTGMMPWECLVAEWDDEVDVNTVNPWEVSAVPPAMVATRHRPPGG